MSSQSITGSAFCPECGARNAQGGHLCANCGMTLTGDVLEPPAAPGAAAQQPPGAAPVAAHRARPLSDPPRHKAIHADPLIGVVIADRYRVVELLGRGGMGVVYKVEHAQIGKLMALKLLTGELSRKPTTAARFKREAMMASRLSHPNTVQVFDYGSSDGLTYLAMEYLRGRDLGEVIGHGPLPVNRTAKIVVQVCSSLAEAHDQGMVHRDMKPENVFILEGAGGDDVVKVLDFGLAKLLESTDGGNVTQAGAIVGTPYYMSPEQIRGETEDPRSDVYSLGALMYAALTGEPVFDAPSAIGVLSRHISDEPDPPHVRRPDLDIPLPVSDIVLRALAKDPALRFQHVRELQQALVEGLRLQGQVSVDALLDSRQLRQLARVEGDTQVANRDEVESYERKLRRRGRVAWAGLGLALLAAPLVGWQVWQRAQADDEFTGVEVEPNSHAADAMPVPFGAEVRGFVGKRIDPKTSDRDFFRIVVPSDVTRVQLETQSLPNFGLCTLLFREGDPSPRARYCPGGPGRDLWIPALEIQPGPYLVAVMQDRDRYTMALEPPVHENVSDVYRLRMGASESQGPVEVEPNDRVRDATRIAVGSTVTGRFGWMRDQDVVCVSSPSARFRFVVTDAQRAPRPTEAVLQVTPRVGPSDGIPVRVFRAGAQVEATPHDAESPWSGPALEPSVGDACLKLQLVISPQAPLPHPRVAPASNAEYEIRVEAL